MREPSRIVTPVPVLEALDEVVEACDVGPVLVVVPARRVASLAYTSSRGGRITLDRDVAGAACSEPEMIRFLLAHEMGHRVRSTRSWTSLVAGLFLMVLAVWFFVMFSSAVAGIATGRTLWVTYGALVLVFLGAWSLAARRDRVTELGCDAYAGDVGFPLTEGAATSLQQLGRSRFRLPRVLRTHPDWESRLLQARNRAS